MLVAWFVLVRLVGLKLCGVCVRMGRREWFVGMCALGYLCPAVKGKKGKIQEVTWG